MKILSRYIFKEMIAPTVLGFSFYTFIILMRNLFDFAGMIIKRSLPAATVGKLLLLSLPHIVVLTVPMSLLFNPFEIAAIVLSVATVTLVAMDGESNWLEGLQLLGLYVILGAAFYFIPA